MQVLSEHMAEPADEGERSRRDGEPPRVSVLITTYRTPAPLLEASLRSALAQSVRDLEVVLVLDGELAPAEQAVVDRASADPRVLVLSPGRVGRGRALNLGLRASQAPVIAIQDADDESHPQRLARQLDVLDRRPDIDLLATGVRLTRRLEAHADWEHHPEDPEVQVLGRELLLCNLLVHSSVAVRRDMLDRVAGYSVGRQRHFDYDLYLRMRNAGGTIAYLDEPLVLRRLHERQSFEQDAYIVQRVWATCKLQMAHSWQEPIGRRIQLMLLVAVRQGGHLLRALIRRRRRSLGRTGVG